MPTLLSCPRRSVIAAALVAAIAALPLAVCAQTASTPTELDTVKVTGNWLSNPTEATLLEHPGARSIVEARRIAESGATSVRDVLRQIPGVQVQESNGTGGSDVSLNVGVRGLTSRLSPRSYVLMDGVPMSYAPYGQPQLSLAPVALGNLESVDVVRGAGSVRYGPQNVGGIINFVTRAIPKDVAGTLGFSSEMYGQGGHLKTVPSLFLGGTTDAGLGLALLYSGTHGEGWRGSNDKTDIDDVLLKASYALGNAGDLALSLHHFEGSGRMPGGLTSAEYAADPFQSTRPYDVFNGRRSDGSLKYTWTDGRNNVEVLGYYVDSFRGSYIEQDGAGTSNGQRRLTAAPRSYHYYGVEPRYSRLFVTGTVVQEVSVGYRYLTEASSEVASRTGYYRPTAALTGPDLPLLPYQTSRGGTTANAFYIDDRIDIGDWTITPGVRVENIRTFNDITNLATTGTVTSSLAPRITSRETLPTLSVLYRLNATWSLFANGGKSFGPQQYSQLASTTEGLHPESATTYELGTHFNGSGLSGEFTLFNVDFDKELQLARSIVGEGMWTDLGATRHRGAESALRYDMGRLSDVLAGLQLSMTYTWTEATARAGAFAGRDLPLYSRNVGSFGARYAIDRWTFNADVFAQSRQRSPGTPAPGAAYVTDEDPSGRLGDIPGYATVALRAGYDFGPELHDLTLAIGVKNLLDHRYYTRSTDNNGGKFVGQPRTVYLQGSLAF